MSEYTNNLTAEELIEYIAKDYTELSQDKILWQRNNHMKICQQWLEYRDKKSRLIENAFRDSESYQVPMTEEGLKLQNMRYYAFKKGWSYAEFYTQTGDVYMKDYNERQ